MLQLQTNKIPHPPPQSTRPTSGSARKIRLPSSIKNSVNIQDSKPNNIGLLAQTNFRESTNDDDNDQKQPYNKSNYSNDSNILNESINDLIQVLKSNQNNNSNLSKTTILASNTTNGKLSEIPNLDDSGNTTVYSFSSKPKPVTLFNSNNNNISQNDSSNISTSSTKNYDYRKYASSHQPLQSNSSIHLSASNKTNSLHQNILSFVKDSLNENENNFYNTETKLTGDQQVHYENLMDSFEARMLQEMKAEMESSKSKNNSNNTVATKSSSSSSAVSVKNNPRSKNQPYQKSPDVDYIERMQREVSGLQSPFSDDNNHTTSEKYNFDAVTSSIEDTTTSLSKRAINRKTKVEESNNYQDEMDVSLLSNLPGKSINFK